MILFLISFLLVFATSYLITSVITPKKSILGLIYIFLIAFAQLVLTFEVLSLFNSINAFWVLIANTLFFVGSSIIWYKKSKPLWSIETSYFKNRFLNSLKLDKSLFILYIGFCALIISALMLCAFMPMTNADAQAYHVARSLFWVLQGSLNHFDTSDIRNLCSPINSEILYSWVILFVRKDVFLGFFSFVGYIMSIISVYTMLGYMGFCTRRKLWVIFILSSFSSVIIQTSSTETDIIIAGLISASMALFWNSLKTDKKTPLFMSALAYALAIGTKTPALIMIPGVGLLLLGLCAYYKKYKPLGLFLSFGLINFIIFSSYNYTLNFIHFGNFMGSDNFIIVAKNYYGLRGMASNFVKYIFTFFDFAGLKWADSLTYWTELYRQETLSFYKLANIPLGYYSGTDVLNSKIAEALIGPGILGLFVFLPSVAWGGLNRILNSRLEKANFFFAFSALFAMNMLVMSYVLAYMNFSVRFIMTMIVLSAPVLGISYIKKNNPLKYIIAVIALFYMIYIPTHINARPLYKIDDILKNKFSFTYLREIASCKSFDSKHQYSYSICLLKDKIKETLSTENRFLAFISDPDYLYTIKSLELQNYKIDIKTMEEAPYIDFNKYNLIIIPSTIHVSSVIKYYDKRKNEPPNRLSPCIYEDASLNPKSNKKIPIIVKCKLSKNFFTQRGFTQISAIGLVRDTFNNSEFFAILKNNKLPLKTKNKLQETYLLPASGY